jgi:translation initiation factor IF-3|tara:strand:- start:5562 stop:6086 length:525 start_codon:yes stop_codon:yes gene_type:complete
MQNKRNFKRNRGPFVIANEKIRHNEVRVSFPDGNSQILSIKDALEEAQNVGLDLVLIAEKAKPPVCKITDLNKHLYELKQKEKLAKKKQRESIVELKEVRMGLNIETHDLETKANMARKFLDKNNKVTVTVVLRGRERGRQDLARELLNTFANILDIEYEQISTQNNRVSGKIK